MSFKVFQNTTSSARFTLNNHTHRAQAGGSGAEAECKAEYPAKIDRGGRTAGSRMQSRKALRFM